MLKGYLLSQPTCCRRFLDLCGQRLGPSTETSHLTWHSSGRTSPLLKKKKKKTMFIAHHSWVLYESHGVSFLPHSSLIQCGRILTPLWRWRCQIGSHWTWLASCQILVSLRSRTDFFLTSGVSVWVCAKNVHPQNYLISWCNWQLCVLQSYTWD